MSKNPFHYSSTSPKIIKLAVMMYVQFPLSLKNVEDLIHERGFDVRHESVRLWMNRFGLMFAQKIKTSPANFLRKLTQWQWHVDEAPAGGFLRLDLAHRTKSSLRDRLRNCEDKTDFSTLFGALSTMKGEVLESYVTKTRD